jgi:uncharacterized membrane protein YvbJ
MNDSLVPCPHCGAEIRAGAKFCRHCGSSDSDGWRNEQDWGDDADDFDYEQFVEREFGTSQTNTAIAPFWRWVAMVLLILFVLSFMLW